MFEVKAETRAALAEIACDHVDGLVATHPHDASRYAIDLDDRTSRLLGIAALIALDGPPASYAGQVASAIEAGATANEILGVLRTIAPHVGRARIVAAAPEIMLALGLSLPETPEPGG
jgi:alkylhydroperoxidase/carboxymuconolactone decarboxylase family protein YurZ